MQHKVTEVEYIEVSAGPANKLKLLVDKSWKITKNQANWVRSPRLNLQEMKRHSCSESLPLDTYVFNKFR